MKVYIVSYKGRIGAEEVVSQEGYSTFEKAKRFIESRSSSPKKVGDLWVWIGDNNSRYYIKEIDIK